MGWQVASPVPGQQHGVTNLTSFHDSYSCLRALSCSVTTQTCFQVQEQLALVSSQPSCKRTHLSILHSSYCALSMCHTVHPLLYHS
jgi:hypothetical protein